MFTKVKSCFGNRPQVGEEAKRLADAEQTLLGAELHRNVGPLRSTNGAKQHCRGTVAGGERRLRQGRARGIVGGAADEFVLKGEVEVESLPDCLEHTHGLDSNFRSNAVAAEHHDPGAHGCLSS
jgi:hypothetical protein